MENVGASEEVAAEGQAEGAVVEGNTGGAGEGQGQQEGEEATQGAVEGAEGQAEGDVEVVERDGKHFIPKERFDQVYGKMKQFETFLETIQSDPEAKRQFIETLSGGQGDTQAKETPKTEQEPSAFEQFLAQTPALANSPEHQALFGNLGKSIAKDLQSHLDSSYTTKAELQKMIAPLMRYIGDTETSRFFEKNPNAKAYQSKIVEVMRQHPTLTIQQASVLASSSAEKVRMAGAAKAKQNQEKISKTPITGKTNSGGGDVKKPLPAGNQGIAEGIKRAFDKLGIKE